MQMCPLCLFGTLEYTEIPKIKQYDLIIWSACRSESMKVHASHFYSFWLTRCIRYWNVLLVVLWKLILSKIMVNTTPFEKLKSRYKHMLKVELINNLKGAYYRVELRIKWFFLQTRCGTIYCWKNGIPWCEYIVIIR